MQVILGDLNYRIHHEASAVKRLVKIHDLDELAKFDEFQQAPLFCKELKGFEEGPLTFDPTYKYNKGSNEYDSSNKQRTPAWCDRILFRSDNNLSQVYYGRSEINLSDHRPVLALFEVKVRKINHEAKHEVKEQLIQKFKSISQSNLLSPRKEES